MEAAPASAVFSPANPPTLGENYSFACAKVDDSGERVFANTSCVNDLGTVYYTAAECVATGYPCEGYVVERVYWQKTTDNRWNPDTVAGGGVPVDATYLDWGDNLESVSWTASSVIRVEMTPFAAVSTQLRGIEMWHVFGQGTNELWGAHATDASTPLPYVYMAEHGIVNTAAARLNISKLNNTPQTCPTEPSGPQVPTGTWDGDHWQGMEVLRDVPFKPELNIGGKYVYGYNWNLRKDIMPTGINKAGWWRLTYYAPGAINFLAATQLVAYVPGSGEPTTLSTAAEPLEETSGPLYEPVSDDRENHNLTYIDICIKEAKGGGKKK
jgi:hypothetical protein